MLNDIIKRFRLIAILIYDDYHLNRREQHRLSASAAKGLSGPGSGNKRRGCVLEHKGRDEIMSIEQFIGNEVRANDVVLFMKGTPQFPQCGFSSQVVQILEHVGVAYKALNVYDSSELRDGIKIYSNWPTIPQLYVKGEFVGGCDIVREMFQAGELQQLFIKGGLSVLQLAN
jgi:monothiol glutaredoxin